jgi:hypothetical protein
MAAVDHQVDRAAATGIGIGRMRRLLRAVLCKKARRAGIGLAGGG